MNIEKMKAFAQAQRESEESTEIRPAPKPAEPEFQPEAIYIPIEDDEPSEIPYDGFARGFQRRRTGIAGNRIN